MPSTQDRLRSNQLIFFQCMGYLQAHMRLGTRQYGKGFHCYSGHFQGFLQGSWALIRTREDMGVNINHSKAQGAWRRALF